jgi:hypothetical protein
MKAKLLLVVLMGMVVAGCGKAGDTTGFMTGSHVVQETAPAEPVQAASAPKK